MIPPDEVSTRAIIYNALGAIYAEAQQTEQAIAHYCESIRFTEQAGDLFGAADTRYNVAITYTNVGRFNDALLFARAALRNYEQFGPAAADGVVRAQELIDKIEQAARRKNQ